MSHFSHQRFLTTELTTFYLDNKSCVNGLNLTSMAEVMTDGCISLLLVVFTASAAGGGIYTHRWCQLGPPSCHHGATPSLTLSHYCRTIIRTWHQWNRWTSHLCSVFIYLFIYLFAQHTIQYTSATSDASWTYAARSQSDTYKYCKSKYIWINQSINQSVFISGKVPIETNNKQTDRQRDT